MTYCFDIDNTLCVTLNKDYVSSKPLPERITVVNKLFDDGHTIKIDTARGSSSGIDWNDLTKQQLAQWGVKYHALRVGHKMTADIFVDDKAILDKDFFK